MELAWNLEVSDKLVVMDRDIEIYVYMINLFLALLCENFLKQ